MERAYDTPDGIKEYLKDLDGLNRFKKDRMEAGYGRKERLQEWLILGRWMTDSCGNFGDCTLLDDRHRPMDLAAGMPQVVSRDDVFKLFHVASTSTNGMICCVPPVRIYCRECGQKWTISNAHDAVVETDTCKVDTAAYVGKTYRQLDDDLRSREDGSYFASFELPVKHERFVDMTPHPTIKDYYVNKDGWVNLADLIRHRTIDSVISVIPRVGHPGSDAPDFDPWTYVFQPGDHTYGNVHYYTHRNCLQLKKSREARDYYVSLFTEAGFPEPVTEEAPNERFSGPTVTPWIVGKFPFGRIKIGWRASVINIDWSGFPGQPDYESLFEGENTTTSPHYVHAHSRAKAVEYLQRLKAAVDAGLRCDRSQCPNPPTRFYHLEGKGLESLCREHDVTMSESRKRLTFLEAVVQTVHET